MLYFFSVYKVIYFVRRKVIITYDMKLLYIRHFIINYSEIPHKPAFVKQILVVVHAK